MKKLGFIAVLVVALTLAWWWTRSVENPYHDLVAAMAEAPASELGMVVTDPAPRLKDHDRTDQASDLAPGEKEALPEEDSVADFDPLDIRQLSPENVVEFTRRNLELALAGDEAAAHRVGRTRFACSEWGRSGIAATFYMQRNNPRARAGRMAVNEISGVQQGSQLLEIQSDFLPGSPFRHIESHDQVASSLQQWHAGCAGHDALFDSGLRQRLDELASQGHVVARYLYATIRLSEQELASSDHLATQLKWERKARRYSRENLEQGHVLGLLAYAHSYRTSTFTTYNSGLSLALYKAMLDCGYDAPDLKAWAGTVFVPHEAVGEDDLFILLVLDEAEKLKQVCRG